MLQGKGREIFGRMETFHHRNIIRLRSFLRENVGFFFFYETFSMSISLSERVTCMLWGVMVQFGFLSKSRGPYVPGYYCMRGAAHQCIHLTLVAAPVCLLLAPCSIVKGLMRDAGEAEGTFETPPACCLGAGSLDHALRLSGWPEVADATTLPCHTALEAAISPGLGSTRLWTL